MEVKELFDQIPICFKTKEEKAEALLLASDFTQGLDCGIIHFNKAITKPLTTVRDILQEIYTNRMIVLWDKYMEDKTIGVSYFDDDLKPISVSVAMPNDRKEFILNEVGIMINRFDGEYKFLSNFYDSKIEYDGLIFGKVEAAYQAQKSTDEKEKEQFTKLNRFDGEYRFLSNFYDSKIEYDGLIFGSVEAAYQAQKSTDEKEKEQFTKLNPPDSKRMGKIIKLRSDWENIKEEIMYKIVKIKFTTHKDLGLKLLATDGKELIEGNTWHDNFFGKCSCDRCRGKKQLNILGQILMKVRDELKEGEQYGETDK